MIPILILILVLALKLVFTFTSNKKRPLLTILALLSTLFVLVDCYYQGYNLAATVFLLVSFILGLTLIEELKKPTDKNDYDHFILP